LPIYAFSCDVCGPFEIVRPMAEAAAAAACPRCGAGARRVFTPPGVARLTAPLRGALDREERSAHEPDVVTTMAGRAMPHRHAPSPPWVLSH
jgi:putative FmdB family regulatory protein